MIDNAFGLFSDQLGGIEQVAYDHYLINPFMTSKSTLHLDGFPNQSEYISEMDISIR